MTYRPQNWSVLKNQVLKVVFMMTLFRYMKGKKKNFVTMYEASKVIRVLDLIRESSEKGSFLKILD